MQIYFLAGVDENKKGQIRGGWTKIRGAQNKRGRKLKGAKIKGGKVGSEFLDTTASVKGDECSVYRLRYREEKSILQTSIHPFKDIYILLTERILSMGFGWICDTEMYI